MKIVFSEEEKWLINLLKSALTNKAPESIDAVAEKLDIIQVVTLAKRHAILSLVYDIVHENSCFFEVRDYIERESKQTVLQTYRLLFLTRYVVEKLSLENIPAVVLKGVATGSMYPVPELRKSGDIDLLVPATVEYNRLVNVMLQEGFSLSKHQHANHHIVFESADGVNIEIHTMFAEPFAYKNINHAMNTYGQECWKHIQWQNIIGVELPILDKPFHAYALLLHMLQHFLYAGFGLKLLCDWVMIWRQEWSVQEKSLFMELIKESGLEKFAEALTSVCITYMGLEQDAFAWEITDHSMADEILREILDAEDFGAADNSRMVMMNGTHLGAYLKEFHHQMHLNFPKAGKCYLLWPILWIITFVKFTHNNRKVRRTSLKKVVQVATRRSKLMDHLRLFQ